MGRTLGFSALLCALALCAAAQSTTTTLTPGTYPAPGQPTSGALPLPAPPEMALPGSGTPVGMPPNIDVNNARIDGRGAVVQPGVSDLTIGGQPVYAEPRIGSTPESTPAASIGQGTIAGGDNTDNAESEQQSNTPSVYVRRMANGMNASGQSLSLGELAAQLHGRKPLPKRTFDNNDIIALNETASSGFRSQREDLPQSDQPATTAPKQTTKPKQVRPKNQAGVLDQNDLREVENALQRSKQKSQSNNNNENSPQ